MPSIALSHRLVYLTDISNTVHTASSDKYCHHEHASLMPTLCIPLCLTCATGCTLAKANISHCGSTGWAQSCVKMRGRKVVLVFCNTLPDREVGYVNDHHVLAPDLHDAHQERGHPGGMGVRKNGATQLTNFSNIFLQWNSL